MANYVIAASLTIALNSLFAHLAVSDILPPDGGFYRWWHHCFFSWQIPAFYCFSGFLYERGVAVDRIAIWGRSVRYRFIVNAVPYVVFTFFMLGVNTLCDIKPTFGVATTADALFVSPLEPYGYFYCLFFMYVFLPTVRTGHGLAIAGVCALAAKAFAITAATAAWPLPYGVQGVADQMIWFVSGMALAKLPSERVFGKPAVGLGLAALYIVTSLLLTGFGWTGPLCTFWCALTAGGAIVGLLTWAFPTAHNLRPLHYLAGFTMAIYLFHPLFLKLLWWAFGTLHVTAALAYILVGAFVAFILPVLVMIALNHIWKLGFIVYPARYIKPLTAPPEKSS